MRDLIACALAWALSALAPRRPGRHSAEYLTALPTPGPASVSPWSRPWTGPTKEEAAEFFRRQAEDTMELGVIRERRRALVLATMGVDYDFPTINITGIRAAGDGVAV
ncbi:hypothetical protein ACIBK8_12520 [Streptomyces sp. NPDC050161]|uniref:hypothetical protein n=1 Tax=Streptomyces sp. NPDC050161 TaxID=3365604 RepID=UPI0037909F9F